ncbi:hypothetical protein HDU76_010808, partial [Blyttiomyces sp. JEL0837]
MDTGIDCTGFFGFSKDLVALGFRDVMDCKPIDAALDANGTLHISTTIEYESSIKSICKRLCWVVPEFRMRNGQQIISPAFQSNNKKWFILIKYQEEDGSMAAYLVPELCETEKSNDG